MLREAIFSKDKKYRFQLNREWDEKLPCIGFILLNPSTADHKKDDPTIRKLICYANKWGFGKLRVVNINPYRSKSPEHLLYNALPDEVREANNIYIQGIYRFSSIVVCGWGNNSLDVDIESIKEHLKPKRTYCFEKNKNGNPRHPLYLPSDIKLENLKQYTI